MAYSTDLKQLPDKPTKEFLNLSKEEIWEILKAERADLISAENDLEKYKNISKAKDDIYTEQEKIINDLKKSYKRFGFDFYILIGIDKTINVDCYVGADFKTFLFKNYISFDFGGALKIYKEIGGALKLGFSVNF